MPDSATPRAERPIATIELLVLTALAALTRFWSLFSPRAVVFDELHYEHFAGRTLEHTFYLDVHPPFANLLYAAEARLFGIGAGTLVAAQPAPALRVLPALCGTLVVALVYIIIRQLGQSRAVAALAALAVLFDNALTVDARFVLLETLIMACALAAIAVYLAARGKRYRWLLFAVSSALAGCAFSVKWTGASALGIILVAWFVDALRGRSPIGRIFGEGALLVVPATAVYVSVFAIQFHLLTRAGPDDAALPPDFKSTLIGDTYYSRTGHPSFVMRLREIHHAMDVGNTTLERVAHPAASPWYTWPIMKHPIPLWSGSGDPPAMIILLGNPVVWWGALVVALVGAFALLRRRDFSNRYALGFLGGAFVLNYLPFVAITRVMYIYHYLFAVVWLAMLGAVMLGTLIGWNTSDDAPWRFATRRSARVYWTVAALVLIGFLFFSPFTYGWHLSQAALDARLWVLHPRV